MPWDGKFFRLDDPLELGRWARYMRKVTNTTSVDVAEAMDCAHNQVCAWERGALVPNLRTALKLVNAHGHSLYIVKEGHIRATTPGSQL